MAEGRRASGASASAPTSSVRRLSFDCPLTSGRQAHVCFKVASRDLERWSDDPRCGRDSPCSNSDGLTTSSRVRLPNGRCASLNTLRVKRLNRARLRVSSLLRSGSTLTRHPRRGAARKPLVSIRQPSTHQWFGRDLPTSRFTKRTQTGSIGNPLSSSDLVDSYSFRIGEQSGTKTDRACARSNPRPAVRD